MTDKEKSVQVIDPQEVCYRAFELMRVKQLEDAHKLLANCLNKTDDDVAVALFHSALGVLFKMKGEYKTAWKHYQRAEKLIPDDPALKIITARLLIDEFAEYDQAIKKAKKALGLIPDNPVFAHQAYVTMGLAYVKKSQKKKAIEMLEKSRGEDFKDFITVQNIDFNLLETLIRKGWGLDSCKTFLEVALAFARQQEDENWIEVLEKMLKTFEKEESV